MIEHYFRPHAQKRLFDPLAKQMERLTLHPKQVTAASIAFGIAIIPALLWNRPYLALSFLLISGLLDILDGSLARLLEKSSPEGAAFDIMGDRIVEFSVILGLYSVSPDSRGLISLLMLGSILLCVTSFLVVGIFEQNDSHKSFHYSPGLMERAEAFTFFAAMILFPKWFVVLGIFFISATCITALIRVREFCKKPNQPSSENTI